VAGVLQPLIHSEGIDAAAPGIPSASLMFVPCCIAGDIWG